MTNPEPDAPELVDPDEPISSYRCALCGEPETTARPITTWAFSLEDGHWHIRTCHQCAHDRIGQFLRDTTGIRAGAFESWKLSFSLFVHQHGTKARIE